MKSKPLISTLDIAWAAGFIEGEGSFGLHSNSPRVSAAQVHKEPIERLVRIFGGDIHQRTTKGFGDKPLWVWRMSSRRAVQIMMTLYVLMSPKRKREIEFALARWRDARSLRSHNATHCLRGHPLSGDNLRMVGKYRKCRTCLIENSRRYRAKRKQCA